MFKSLAPLGLPNFDIDINGTVFGRYYNRIKKPKPQPGSSVPLYKFHIGGGRCVYYYANYLVGELFWMEDIDTIMKSPFKDTILTIKEYYSLGVNQKRRLTFIPQIDNIVYDCDHLGRIWSLPYKYILSPHVERYCLILLSRKTYLVHRIVATAWIPNPLNKPEVDHIDCNKTNNHPANLQWVYREENQRYMSIRGAEGEIARPIIHDIMGDMASNQYLDLTLARKYHVSLAFIKKLRAGVIYTDITEQYGFERSPLFIPERITPPNSTDVCIDRVSERNLETQDNDCKDQLN